MAHTLGAALGAAIALGVLLGYAPIHKRTRWFGINYSPRLMACWLLPIVDIVVTLWLIAGNWFGLGSTNMGFMMTQLTIWTAIGLSLTVLIVRKMFKKTWIKQYEAAKRFGGSKRKRRFA